jgi:hypothetical protein
MRQRALTEAGKSLPEKLKAEAKVELGVGYIVVEAGFNNEPTTETKTVAKEARSCAWHSNGKENWKPS